MNRRFRTGTLSRKNFLRAMGFSAAGLVASGCTPEQPKAPVGEKNNSAEHAKITFVLDYTPNTNHTRSEEAHV